VSISDISGKLDSLQMVSLNNIKLGNITFNNIPTVVAKDFQLFECFKVDGFIGSNLLRNSIVQFASQTHTLTITDVPKQLDLKGKAAIKMITDPSQSNPYINIDILNGKDTVTEELLFDSGSDSFYDISYKNFKEIQTVSQLKIEAQAVGSYSLGLYGPSDEEENYRILIPELKLNGYTFKNVPP